jgi:hypothetical protein
MVVIVRSLGVCCIWLAVSALCATPQAQAAGVTAPSYLRTSLDEDAPAPSGAREPRRFRTSLDDVSHASFPLDNARIDPAGRLIRISLDDGSVRYGHLSPAQAQARRYRTTLD